MSSTFIKPVVSTMADVLANLINGSLQTITISCARNSGVDDLYYVGVIGYGAQVGSAFASSLSEKILIPTSEIANNPARIGEVTKQVDDGAGGMVDVTVKFPVWLDPVAVGDKPMSEALALAKETLAEWLQNHKTQMSPLVVNLIGNTRVDDDWTSSAEELKSMTGDFGNVVLLNYLISTSQQPVIMFPGDEQCLPDEGSRACFRASSLLNGIMIDQLKGEEIEVAEGARAFGLNPPSRLIDLFVRGFDSRGDAGFGAKRTLNNPACILFLIDQSNGMTRLMGQAEETKVEESKTEVPQAEELKIDEPQAQELKVEEPKAEEPKVEEPKVEEPQAEEPKVEEPQAEEPKVEESQAQELKAEEPKAEEPKAEEPKVEEPKVEEPKVEEPKVEEPQVEEPKIEEPQPEEPKVEESKVEEPQVEEPKIEEPQPQEPKAEEPKAQQESATPKNNMPDWLADYLPSAGAPQAPVAESQAPVAEPQAPVAEPQTPAAKPPEPAAEPQAPAAEPQEVAVVIEPPTQDISPAEAVTLTDEPPQPADPVPDEVKIAEPQAEPEAVITLDLAGAVDADDLARLVTALDAHDARRRGAAALEADGRRMENMRATCLTLIVGPSELGTGVNSSPQREQARAILQRVGPTDLPEARLCHLWLSCYAGERSADAVEEFAVLARESLWEPVLALVYRGLAHFGQRRLLADLLPQSGSLSLVQADAWLDAAHAFDVERQWIARLDNAPHELASDGVSNQWRQLLEFETALVCGAPFNISERDFDDLLNLKVGEQSARTYEEALTRRLAARVASALTRSRLGARRDDGSLLLSEAGQLLPIWERQYLQSLARWQRNNLYEAINGLEDALQHNPHQPSLRLALAALLAPQSLEKALSALECSEPSREILVSRAALLARRGTYAEAEQTLARVWSEPIARCEPLRFSWAKGREQYRQREQFLRTALAEQRNDWNTARKAWRIATADQSQQNEALWFVINLRKTLREVRELYMVRRELESVTSSQSWLRSMLQQRLKRGSYAASKIPLAGDALFFRAAAMLDVFPKRAVRDFLALLQQRDWVEIERSVGGGRIVYAGDALLRFGRADDAIRAYQLSNAIGIASLKERQAIAHVFAEVMRRAEAEAIRQAASRSEELAPGSSWTPLLAALGLVIAGEMEAAAAEIKIAGERGAAESTCRYLQTLCAPQDQAGEVPEVKLSTLQQPEEIEAVARLLCGQEIEPGSANALDQLLGEGWMTGCLVNPYITASRLLANWCDEAKWEEALRCAQTFSQSGITWAVELAALVRLRNALILATRGELEDADAELSGLQVMLQTNSN